MKYSIDHDFHIHSCLSSCSSDPEQSTQSILRYAENMGLKKICLTDHYWDEKVAGASSWYKKQDTAHIKESLPLPKSDTVEFLFGCETDLNKEMTLGISKERFSEMDFVIIPTTHLHMNGFTIPENFADTPKNRADLWVKRLDALLSMDLPFKKIGIAHLTCRLINKRSPEEYLKTLELISEDEMTRLFTKAASLGCGIELNQDDMSFRWGGIDTVLRPFKIAKSCGCKFYLGTDAHHQNEFNGMREIFESAVEKLGLTEDDKFAIR